MGKSSYLYIIIIIIMNIISIGYFKIHFENIIKNIINGGKMDNLDKDLKKILLDLVYFKESGMLKTSYNGVQITINLVTQTKLIVNMMHTESGCFYQIQTSELKLSDFSTIGDYKFIMEKLKNDEDDDKTLTLHTAQLNEYTKNGYISNSK